MSYKTNLLMHNYSESSLKLESYLNAVRGNPSNHFFKAARILNPRQESSLPQDVAAYASVKGISVDNPRYL